MKKIIILALTCSTLIFISGCGNKKQQGVCPGIDATGRLDTSRDGLLQAVRAVEAKLKASSTLETYTANLAITAYTNYAKYFPNDTLSAAFLFNAAGLASSTGQYPKAISLYSDVTAKYPQTRFIPECLLVQGFIYDNNLQDTAKARQKYSELVTRFPHDSLATQARQAMKFLGKSADEIGKEFEKQNKEKEKKEHKKARV